MDNSMLMTLLCLWILAIPIFAIVAILKPELKLLRPLAAVVGVCGLWLAAWLVPPQVGEKAKDWGILASSPRARLFRARSQRQQAWQWAAACWGRVAGFISTLNLPREPLHQPRRPAPASPSPSSGDCTELLYPCRQALIQAMDTQTRSAWRLVNTQTCLDVYKSTHSLTWRSTRKPSAGRPPGSTTLHLPLFSNCQGLKMLQCEGMTSLRSLATFPRGLQLEVLDLSCTVMWRCRDFSPLTHCCTPEGRQTLKELNLTGNKMGPEGAAALAPALKALTGLERLDLVYNSLDAEGAAALAPALQALTGLQQLKLGSNDLGPGGLAALVPALHSLTGLQQLDLRGTYMHSLGTRSAIALAPALRSLELQLQRNDPSAQGAATLAPALEAAAELQHLDDRRLDAFNLGLKQELEVRVSAALVQALQLLHPQLHIMT